MLWSLPPWLNKVKNSFSEVLLSIIEQSLTMCYSGSDPWNAESFSETYLPTIKWFLGWVWDFTAQNYWWCYIHTVVIVTRCLKNNSWFHKSCPVMRSSCFWCSWFPNQYFCLVIHENQLRVIFIFNTPWS